jgi:hypothetical protein
MTEVRNLASKISLGTSLPHRPEVGWQGGEPLEGSPAQQALF